VIDPASRLKPGVDIRRGETVVTKAGASLVILPVLIRPIDVLLGKCLGWHLDLLELRNQWAAASRRNLRPEIPGEIVATVAREAVASSYVTTGGVIDEWFTDDDGESLIKICTAAMGANSGNVAQADVRRRALCIALAGCGEVPLTAIETAIACDFVINSGRAPEGV